MQLRNYNHCRVSQELATEYIISDYIPSPSKSCSSNASMATSRVPCEFIIAWLISATPLDGKISLNVDSNSKKKIKQEIKQIIIISFIIDSLLIIFIDSACLDFQCIKFIGIPVFWTVYSLYFLSTNTMHKNKEMTLKETYV